VKSEALELVGGELGKLLTDRMACPTGDPQGGAATEHPIDRSALLDAHRCLPSEGKISEGNRIRAVV
jgi:hypothetical protein